MIEATFPTRELDRLARAAKEAGKDIRRESAIAVNATARKGRSVIAKQITQELATTQKVVKRHIYVVNKASALRVSSTLRLEPSSRIPLRDFKPTQNKRGVSYRVSKTEGRKTIPGAFIVNRYGGHVYKRPNPGSRAVGRNKKGASPWGVYVKQNYRPLTVKQLDAELAKQLDRRTRFIRMRMEGKI